MLDLQLPIQQNSKERSERRDAAENRQLILATAADLFVKHGVETVCMSDIAKAAAVGKGTLYRRFSSKGELCLTLLDSELRHFQNDVIETFRQQTVNGRTACERLNWFIEQAVTFTSDHLSLMVEISEAGGENAVQDINQPHFWFEMTVRGLLQEMIIGEQLPADTDLNYITSALLAPLDARIMKAHLGGRGFTQGQISAGLQRIVSGLCQLRS